MSNKKNAIICDLDGVLCNHSHRIHLVDPEKDRTVLKDTFDGHIRYRNADGTKWEANYTKFYEKMAGDKLNTWCALILESYGQRDCGKIIFVTGRPESYENATRNWIEKHLDIMGRNSSGYILHMRPTYRDDVVGCALPPIKIFDTRPAHEFKQQVYQREISYAYDVDFVLEDNHKCVEMYRNMGLICLDVGRR